MEDQVRVRFEVQTKSAQKALQDFGVQIDKTTNKVKIDLDKMGSAFQKTGRRLSLFLTAPLAGLGTMALKTAGEFEKQQIAFETMLGSADKARAMLKDLVEFSAKTPFQLQNLEENTAQLLSFGVASERVVKVLGMLGDVAMGDQEKLNRIAYAYGVIRSRGVATLEQLNILIQAGVPILDKLANQLGVTKNELFKMISQGKVTFEDVNNALVNMTTKGGQFYQMTKKQSQSLLGLFSTLKDNIALLLKEFGDVMLPVAKKIIDHLTVWVQKFKGLDEHTKKLIITFAGLVAAVGPLLLSIGTLMRLFSTMKMAISGIKTAFTLLSNPIGWIILAIGALATASYLLIKHWDEVKNTLGKIWGWIRDKAVLIFTGVKNTIIKSLITILEKVKGLAQVFGLSGAKIQRAIDNLNKKLVTHTSNWRGSVREVNNYSTNVKDVGEKINTLKNQLPQVTTNQNNLNTAVKKGTEEVKKIVLPLKTYQTQLQRTGEYIDNFKKKTVDMTDVYQHFGVTAQDMNSLLQDSFMNAWAGIWDVTKSMEEKVKGAVKDLFVALLKAIGKQLIIAAAGYVISGQFGKAALATALSASAFAGASFINSLQQGGFVQGYGGGDKVPAMLEPGEMVIRKEVVKEQGAILNAINSGEPAPVHLAVYLGSKLLFNEITNATKNGQIIVDKRAVR